MAPLDRLAAPISIKFQERRYKSMRKKYIFGKKLYISILTTIVVLFTTVATTFAWVGVFANSTFDEFEFNIKASSLEEYSLEISTNGIDFSDTIQFSEIKKQILLNWGYPEEQLYNNDRIDFLYSTLIHDQCTTIPVVQDNKIIRFNQFTDVHGDLTTKYYKFDIYISARKNYDTSVTNDYNLDVFLGKKMLSGHINGKKLINPITFPSDFENPYDNLINNGVFQLPNGYRTVIANETVSYARVDSASACRVGFEKYPVVEKYHPEAYNSTQLPNSGIIYQTDYEYPVYNENDDVYSFGAILPNSSNFATLNYNASEWQFTNWKYWTMSIPDEILSTRGVDSITKDTVLSTSTNHLIDSTNSNEKIGVNQMMKMTIYFWFEGWDADCWNAINASPVNIDITFLPRNEE